MRRRMVQCGIGLAACLATIMLLGSQALVRALPAAAGAGADVPATPSPLGATLPITGNWQLFLPRAMRLAGAPSATPTATQTATATATPTATPQPPGRTWPDTSTAIAVFNDQLDPNMSDAQWAFAASHYVGAQKMVRSAADRLRGLNPGFLILHYRLGLGLGYRGIEDGCTPSGEYIQIVEGDEWVREWPADGVLDPRWFYDLPGQEGVRVLNCDWGWYLMDLADGGWRSYWQGEVARQIAANDDDGVFMDSLSVPSYLGADRYVPPLPAVDAAFESAWAQRIDGWLAWLQTQPTGRYAIVPNAGAWITTRDPTTYAAADGVMIEGFALWGDGDPFERSDWELQMDRCVRLVAQEKLLLAQSYATAPRERMFALGSFLLVKGAHSYLNLELGMEPEWWPEYAIDLGPALVTATDGIGELAQGDLYRRDFANGFVLVNPNHAGAPVSVNLDAVYQQVEPQGGGFVPADGSEPGSLSYTAVSQVTLPPYSAAVLLNSVPRQASSPAYGRAANGISR